MNDPIPDPYLPPDQLELGAYMAFMAYEQRRWIRRRVETLEIVDLDRIHRRMSVDFLQPRPYSVNGSPITVEGDEGVSFIPLLVAEKHTLENFSVRDEHGAVVPVLNSIENGPAAEAAVTYALSRDHENQVVSSETRDIVLPRIPSLVRANNELEAGRLLDEVWDQLGGEEQYLEFVENTTAGGLLEWLSFGYLLMARIEGRKGDRRVLKVSYDVENSEPKFSWRRPGVFRQDFVLEQASSCPSYHVEVVAPGELTLKALRGVYRDANGIEVPIGPSGPLGQRGHVNFPRLPRGRIAWVEARLHLPSGGLVDSGFVLSTVAGLLFGMVSYVSLGWRDSKTGIDDDSFIALVAALPGILAAFYWRPSEHPHFTRAFRPMRIALAAVSVSSILAAGVLALNPSSPWKAAIAGVTAVICLCVAWLFKHTRDCCGDGPSMGSRVAWAAAGVLLLVTAATLDTEAFWNAPRLTDTVFS